MVLFGDDEFLVQLREFQFLLHDQLHDVLEKHRHLFELQRVGSPLPELVENLFPFDLFGCHLLNRGSQWGAFSLRTGVSAQGLFLVAVHQVYLTVVVQGNQRWVLQTIAFVQNVSVFFV